MTLEVRLNYFSRSMSTRTSDKHTDSGGLDIGLAERNGNVKCLTEGGFVSFIDVNDGINFEIIDSSDDFVPELADRDNEPFGNFRVSKLSIHLDLYSKNIHRLFKSVLLFTIDAVNHVEFRR